MNIPGYTVRITPTCVTNHGIENRVDYALSLLRERMIKGLKAFPDSTIKVDYQILEKD